ncbi:DUF1653 domain-containing protein [Defluviimonas salinarum]|uniref:DUF1653 domain-containing protein n=1 Tax=Defluviimonas salinarum TaxID=2992147 RepID=A0ABT3J5I6_9RHOB|nr:DUF1653 domain-containing protein [Defluviimonas salinarum]MCW3782921.1 DUF1653 domain-containing protein [Defluviimonas salinarum]
MKSDDAFLAALERGVAALELHRPIALELPEGGIVNVVVFALHADDLSVYLLHGDAGGRLGALSHRHELETAPRCGRAGETLPAWENGPRYRHRKGGEYRLLGSLALDRPAGRIMTALYRAEADGTLWLRDAAEFFDGRFSPI